MVQAESLSEEFEKGQTIRSVPVREQTAPVLSGRMGAYSKNTQILPTRNPEGICQDKKMITIPPNIHIS